jgi:hypothetical protein
MRIQGSPDEIQTPAQKSMTGGSMIAPPIVLLPSSILPNLLVSCPFIPAQKNSAQMELFFVIYNFFGACEIFPKTTISFVMFVRLYVPACNNSACNGRIFIPFDI